jgi:hypothetical protein
VNCIVLLNDEIGFFSTVHRNIKLRACCLTALLTVQCDANCCRGKGVAANILMLATAAPGMCTQPPATAEGSLYTVGQQQAEAVPVGAAGVDHQRDRNG